jgi:hypothetical protein
MAMGVVDGFSWRQVAAGALSAGAGSAISGYVTGGKLTTELIRSNSYGKIAASAALNAAGSYASNKIAGLDASFSWASIASSAVASVASAGVSKGLGLTTDNFAHNLANGLIGGQIGGSTQRLMGVGGKIDYAAVAADAFGNAIGNGIVEASLTNGNFWGPEQGRQSQREAEIAWSRNSRDTSTWLASNDYIVDEDGVISLSPMTVYAYPPEPDRDSFNKADGGATWIGNVVRSTQASGTMSSTEFVPREFMASDVPEPYSPIDYSPKVDQPFSLDSWLTSAMSGANDYINNHSPFNTYAYNNDPINNALVFVNNAYIQTANLGVVGLSLLGDAYYESGAFYVFDPFAGSVFGSGLGMIRQAAQASRAAREAQVLGRGAVPGGAFSADDLVRQINLGGNTDDIASALARQFTHSAAGSNSGSVILGRWSMTLDGPGSSSMGYIDIAKRNGGTWFETPDSFWPQLREGFVRSGVDPRLAMRMADDAAFKVNEQFFLQQAAKGMNFKLVNTTPRHAEQYFRNSATVREIDLLNSDLFKNLGYVKKGNSWTGSQQ